MFDKQAFTIQQQIKQLINRGLIISDQYFAIQQLSHISYYRLAGYWWPMQYDKVNHLFKPQSIFEDVIALYNFDRELRLLIFNIIERIEISIRTKLIYHLSHEFDPWWFQNSELFKDPIAHKLSLDALEKEVRRSKDEFIKKHFTKHADDHRLPPSWKTLEQASFGTLSKLYGNLKNNIKSKDIIAKELGTPNHTYLPSWLQAIAQIRNFCAHHSRLWNRNLPGKPKLMTKPANPWLQDIPKSDEFHYLYIHLCCMKYLLNVIRPQNDFTAQIINLLNKYDKNIDPAALGLKKDWFKEELWRE